MTDRMTQYPYPPPPGGMPPSQPPPRKSPNTSLIVALVAVGVLVFGGLGFAAVQLLKPDAPSGGSVPADNPPADEEPGDQPGDAPAGDQPEPPPAGGDITVVVNSCTVDGTLYEAALTVTNKTSKSANVTVAIEWLDAAGKRLASDNEFLVALAPGKSEAPEAVGSGPRNPGTIHCVTKLS